MSHKNEAERMKMSQVLYALMVKSLL